MVDFFKRGVSAKDLRPFSVEDPLGQKRAPSAQTDRSVSPFPGSTARLRRPPARTDSPVAPAEAPAQSQPAAARVARLGCLIVMGLWLVGLFEGATTWVPKFVDRARPVIERLIAEWEQRQQDERSQDDGVRPRAPGDPMPASPPPRSPEQGEDDSQPAPPLLSSQPTDGAATPPPTGLAAVCERTVACCLVVQGARARALCENFRRLPTSAPCEQAYEVFAQVARDTGRTCQ